MLVNGLPGDCINAEDRGLSYGDGVFRTLRVRDGKPINWQHHLEKLRHDCNALALNCPDESILLAEIRQVSGQQAEGVVKIIVTRGRGRRGYAMPETCQPNRIVSCQPLPQYPESFSSAGITAHLCRIELGHQPALAGIKHLNRLENVLAATECTEAGLPEGLLQDYAGNVIGGTRSNLFMVKEGGLFTPGLSECGVAGVQRERVMAWAREHHVECTLTHLQMEDLRAADEIFLVNSVFGLWPIREFPGYFRTDHPMSITIRSGLAEGESR